MPACSGAAAAARVLIAAVLVAFCQQLTTFRLYPHVALPDPPPTSHLLLLGSCGSFSAFSFFFSFKFASNEVCPQNVAAHFEEGRQAASSISSYRPVILIRTDVWPSVTLSLHWVGAGGAGSVRASRVRVSQGFEGIPSVCLMVVTF